MSRGGSGDIIRMVLDDDTVARLRDAAEVREIEVEQLMIQLLVAASTRIDELVGTPRRGGGSPAPDAGGPRHDLPSA